MLLSAEPVAARGDLLADAVALGHALAEGLSRTSAFAWLRRGVRWCVDHTGLPAVLVVAVVLVVSYRFVKSGMRFAAEVAAVALLLGLLSELGWIRW